MNMMTAAKLSLRAVRLFGLVAVVAMIVAGPAHAASVGEVLKKIQTLAPAQWRASLDAGAKSEGQLVFYASVSLTDYPKILAAFEQSFPYIKTNALSLDSVGGRQTGRYGSPNRPPRGGYRKLPMPGNDSGWQHN